MNRSRRHTQETGSVTGFYRDLRMSRLHFHTEQESERLIASMPLPDPFDLDRLIGNMSEVRGRRIVMKPIPDHLTGLDGVCGLLVTHDTHPVDLLLHPKGRSPSDELELKVHQLAHLWAGDNTGVVRSPDAPRARTAALDDGIPTTWPQDRDALIELRADHVARLIGQRIALESAGEGRPPRAVPHEGGAPARP